MRATNILSSPVTLAIRDNNQFVTSKNFEKGKTYIFVLEDSFGYGECDCTVYYYDKEVLALSLLYYVYGNMGEPSEAITYTGFVNVNQKTIYYTSLKGTNGGTTFKLKAILEM